MMTPYNASIGKHNSLLLVNGWVLGECWSALAHHHPPFQQCTGATTYTALQAKPPGPLYLRQILSNAILHRRNNPTSQKYYISPPKLLNSSFYILLMITCDMTIPIFTEFGFFVQVMYPPTALRGSWNIQNIGK